MKTVAGMTGAGPPKDDGMTFMTASDWSVGLNSPTSLGQAQLLGNDSAITPRGPDTTYRVASGAVNNFGDIDIGGSGA